MKTYAAQRHPGTVQVLSYVTKIPLFVCQLNHHESVIYVTGSELKNSINLIYEVGMLRLWNQSNNCIENLIENTIKWEHCEEIV